MGLYDHHRNDFCGFYRKSAKCYGSSAGFGKRSGNALYYDDRSHVLLGGADEDCGAAGLIEGASKKLEPLLTFLFPSIPKDHKAREYISTNMIANFFGLGWAATPAGIKAMEELEKLEDERRKSPVLGKRGVPKGIANTEMCTFLIVNISSLQLIPINIIAYRTQYGSTNPTRIVGGAILATTVSTAVGVIFAWVMERVKKV